eukprot:1796444-Prymnesium_polylepis.1
MVREERGRVMSVWAVACARDVEPNSFSFRTHRDGRDRCAFVSVFVASAHGKGSSLRRPPGNRKISISAKRASLFLVEPKM